MIIGRARLGTIVWCPSDAQLGPDWYTIDRRHCRPGQGEIADGSKNLRRLWRSVARQRVQQSFSRNARSIALNTWLGRNGFLRKPSGWAIRARSVVSLSTSPD